MLKVAVILYLYNSYIPFLIRRNIISFSLLYSDAIVLNKFAIARKVWRVAP